jgi:S-adenosylmethionine:tRNA ribosyltransferase-isomerase
VRIEELDFDLAPEAVAQEPAQPRDSCRLMHLSPDGLVRHRVFTDLEYMLEPGDLLVFNDSKVLPARIEATKTTGGQVELLFVKQLPVDGTNARECWEVLVRPSRRLRAGSEVLVGGTDRLTFVEALGEGRWVLCGGGDRPISRTMDEYGRLPLPPYIRSYPSQPLDYQTVYARVPGSAAAPTAGLHFTETLLDRLRSRGVVCTWVTLHVGLDTFLPIRESVVERHRIHTECFDLPAQTVAEVKRAKQRGKRVIAVGTTAARVLETAGRDGLLTTVGPDRGMSGSTSIFITPGHEFRVVDTLLTNFHLPRSTVLALTMAFAGVERIREAYAEALAHGYRFFSFGDAMLVEKPSVACDSKAGARA